jgi:hypothetical protein
MSHLLVAGVLVAHGLITTAIGFGAVTNPSGPAMVLPTWFAWWPGPFGRSWLFEALSLGTGASLVGGFIWLIAGLLLVAGGLGWFGLSILEGMRAQLLLAGAGLSLVALALYFHPLYLVALAIDMAIVVLLWGEVLTARAAT